MTSTRLTLFLVFLVGVIPGLFFPSLAFAQQADVCAGTEDQHFFCIFWKVGDQIGWLPQTMAVLSYFLATFFTFTGLMQLKAHMDDPSQSQIHTIIARFAIAGLLIALPLTIDVIAGTMLGRTSAEAMNDTVGRQRLVNGNGAYSKYRN